MDKKTASPAKPGTPQTAEAVWGSPGLEKTKSEKHKLSAKNNRNLVKMKRKKKDVMIIQPISEKSLCFSLIQSARLRKNELGQAAMRRPQVSQHVRSRAVD